MCLCEYAPGLGVLGTFCVLGTLAFLERFNSREYQPLLANRKTTLLYQDQQED